ncbi:MAG: glycosyltransferase [bacterium]|jgi:glycosyltransferase involved in cell wall biosynthesis
MKILQVIHDFLPRHQAGSELYCYHLSRSLQQRGHEVRIFYSEIDHERPNYSTREADYDGIPVYEIVNNHAFSSFEETWSNPAAEHAFEQILDTFQPDLVHFHHLLNLSYGCVTLCREKNIPVVFTLHDYWLTCPRGGGQRFRGEGEICHEVDSRLCADCISRYSFPSSRMIRFIKRLVSRFERVDDPTLLSRMLNGTIETRDRNFVSRGFCTIDGDQKEVLYAHPPSRITFPLDIPPQSTLIFSIAMDPSTYEHFGDGVRFGVEIEGTSVYSLFLNAKEKKEDQGWHHAQVSLADFEGKGRMVTFQTEAYPQGIIDFCTACWAEPKLLTESTDMYQPSLTRKIQSKGERLLGGVQRSRLKSRVENRREATLQLFHDTDLFIAPSRFLREKFIEYGLNPEKIIYSDYGIAPLSYTPGIRKVKHPIRFTYVGTLVEHKGLHVLIEAFNQLPQDQAILNVYGSLNEFTGYVHRIQSMIQHPGITLRGRVENHQITRILEQTDVLVIPSIWFENSPITIHEAFLARVPVITSRFGGMAGLVRDEENGLLFEMGDSKDLLRCLMKLVYMPETIEKLRPHPNDVKTLEDDAEWMEAQYVRLLK